MMRTFRTSLSIDSRRGHTYQKWDTFSCWVDIRLFRWNLKIFTKLCGKQKWMISNSLISLPETISPLKTTFAVTTQTLKLRTWLRKIHFNFKIISKYFIAGRLLSLKIQEIDLIGYIAKELSRFKSVVSLNQAPSVIIIVSVVIKSKNHTSFEIYHLKSWKA